ncbi:hypothetical protein F5146DRAFT_1227330 [Armillaria mellea]|nr:hypothetical protein F5146DRAFT_1227330 [Armillaria mellea]
MSHCSATQRPCAYLHYMDIQQPQLIGPLELCFELKKNGADVRVDKCIKDELESLASTLVIVSDFKDEDARKKTKIRLRKMLLSICDSWTVIKGKKYLHNRNSTQAPAVTDVEVQTPQDPNSGVQSEASDTNIDMFTDIVFSPPLRGKVPSEGIEQWRDQLLALLRNITVQDREVVHLRVSKLVWVELMKPTFRGQHLNLLNGTKIGRYDISEWYAIPIELAKPCKFCDGKFPCTWSRGSNESKRCRECILASRTRCFSQTARTGSHRSTKKQLMPSDDSDYRGRICADDGFLPLPTTRRAEKEIPNVVETVACGQKRPRSPSTDNSQSSQRARTYQGNNAFAETSKMLVTDDDFQDSVSIAARILQVENATEDTRNVNKDLWRANESLKAEMGDLKETTLKTLKRHQADITHLESILETLR